MYFSVFFFSYTLRWICSFQLSAIHHFLSSELHHGWFFFLIIFGLYFKLLYISTPRLFRTFFSDTWWISRNSKGIHTYARTQSTPVYWWGRKSTLHRGYMNSLARKWNQNLHATCRCQILFRVIYSPHLC